MIRTKIKNTKKYKNQNTNKNDKIKKKIKLYHQLY